MKLIHITALAAAFTLVSCGGDNPPTESPEPTADAATRDASNSGIGAITAAKLAAHTKVLASDAFEGRSPSSLGEERTVRYLSNQFERLGLEPGADGTWFQPVPLIEITASKDATLAITGKNTALNLRYGDDMVVWTKRVVDSASLNNSDLVFVGYGIVAPEYDWNDYAGIDVKGKTVIILVNDPGFASQNPELFRGNAMTYYGRWTYKYEEAARQGAAGAIVVHQTDAAGYPWEVVSGGWSGPNFDLVAPDRNMSRAAVEGWVTEGAITDVIAAAGMNFADLRSRAQKPGFKPVPMPLQASVTIKNETRESLSHNVLAVLRGAVAPDEFVVYMAHWDHLGLDPELEGDQIYNGAVDNATGTAALLVLAEAFNTLPQPPDRSILFLAVTAEESGLLGSRHYASNPVYPLAKTVAGINMDALNVSGRTRDISVVGFGSSELEAILADAAKAQGRTLVPEATPEKGFFYRSDHFNLAKVGVPVLYAESGIDSVEHGAAWGSEQAADYIAKRYHKPGDEYDPSWDLSGAVEDIQLYFDVGRAVSRADAWPNWLPGTEFRAIRDASRP